MSTSRTVTIDQLVDPTGATVMVRLDGERPVDAWFQMDGLPRVEGFLVGKPVGQVPAIVERLCGICPASHHLAGTAALDVLTGAGSPPPLADASRRLLNLASILEAHATRLFPLGPDHALVARAFAKKVMAATGSPGYFPATAVPGGVRQPISAADRDHLLGDRETLLGAATKLLAAAPDADTPPLPFEGPDAALIDAAGNLDLNGDRLRVIAADGSILIDGATVDQWCDLVAETYPGQSSSRPYLTALGPTGFYRVGPIAELRIGPVTTPQARAAQQAWTGGPLTARAIIGLHAAEAILAILDDMDLDGAVSSDSPTTPTTIASGWVESPRGLLVHTYTAAADGALESARIVTPTAQNEPWLAELLRTATADLGGKPGPVAIPAAVAAVIEDAIRTADPCLPCSSAPPGQMGLTVMLTCDNEFPPTPTKAG